MEHYKTFINKIQADSTDVKIEFYVSGVYNFISREIDNVKQEIQKSDEVYNIHKLLCGINIDVANDINSMLGYMGFRDNSLNRNVTNEAYMNLVKDLKIYEEDPKPLPPPSPPKKPEPKPLPDPKKIAKSLASPTPSPFPPASYSGLEGGSNNELEGGYKNEKDTGIINIINTIDVTLIDIDILIGKYTNYKVDEDTLKREKDKDIEKVNDALVESKKKLNEIKSKFVKMCDINMSGTLIAYVLPEYYIKILLKDIDSIKTLSGESSHTINSFTKINQTGKGYDRCKSEYDDLLHAIKVNQQGGAYLNKSDLLNMKTFEQSYIDLENKVTEKQITNIIKYIVNNLIILQKNATSENPLEKNGSNVSQSLKYLDSSYSIIYNIADEIEGNFCDNFGNAINSINIDEIKKLVPTLYNSDKHNFRENCKILFKNIKNIVTYINGHKPLYKKVPQINEFTTNPSIKNFIICINYILRIQIISHISKMYNFSPSIFNHVIEDVRAHIDSYLSIHKTKTGKIEDLKSDFARGGLSENNLDELKAENKKIKDKLLKGLTPNTNTELLSIMYDRIVTRFNKGINCENTKNETKQNIMKIMEDIDKFRKILIIE